MMNVGRTGFAAVFGVVTTLAFPAAGIAQSTIQDRNPTTGTPQQPDIVGAGSPYGPDPLFGPQEQPAPRAPMSEASERYGSPADGMPYDQAIRLGPGTRSVSVSHGQVVKFTTADGREFRWRFDTLRDTDVFPLARIAPAGIPLNRQAAVYVNGDAPEDRS